MFQELVNLPEVKTLFTVNSPFDLVGIGFFALVVYTLVGGTISMIRHQVKYVAHAVSHRRAPSVRECHSYTRSIIDGTAPELLALRRTRDAARRGELLRSMIHTLDEQDPSPIARAVVKSLRDRL